MNEFENQVLRRTRLIVSYSGSDRIDMVALGREEFGTDKFD